jgi:hypothetical protein
MGMKGSYDICRFLTQKTHAMTQPKLEPGKHLSTNKPLHTAPTVLNTLDRDPQPLSASHQIVSNWGKHESSNESSNGKIVIIISDV